MKKFRYLPNTEQDRQDMLEVIGAKDIMDLFSDIPENVRLDEPMDLPASLSEYELLKHARELASKNTTASELPYFLGAGVYDHHIPAVVNHIISRQEFLTAYVPYQPEISQGGLQALFEWQTMICELTGMDVTNSGMYDGFNALAEAANLAIGKVRKTNKILVSKAVHPQGIEVLHTYSDGMEYQVEEIGLADDVTNLEELKEKLDAETAAVVVQYPNFFGSIEDLKEMKEIMADSKALLIVSSNPLALGKLESPGALGADIVVGDMQPFGIAMSFGGPHAGYLAVTNDLMRKLPSRIVGQTADVEGKRGFVLSLTTREQHIRREKATSNYSSNQALFTLASAIAMTAYGKQGIQDLAQRNITNAHYLGKQLQEKGFELVNQSPYFNEFLVKLDHPISAVNESLFEKGFIGGYDASSVYGTEHVMLICATEKRTKGEMDAFVDALVEVAK
ncbi:MAG TPA: aminomethyl-transferring glycine dehydrogenase subunit GcvPA [Atopostipes sp.]|nr:aminomethyl-transferring glycine dehydrogenase subunit GcvPA [Atopostipes sp.]